MIKETDLSRERVELNTERDDTAGQIYRAGLVSVTRCQIKKQPNFAEKLPRKWPHYFLLNN